MPRLTRFAIAALVLAAPAARAQNASIVYTLGKDTVAVETYTRTATKMSGEMVTRSGTAVARTQYEFTMAGGRVTAAMMRRRGADGSIPANTPTEWRFTFTADSATRTTVWPDSAPARTFAAKQAFPTLPVFVYAPYELLQAAAKAGGRRDSVPMIPTAGAQVGNAGIEAYAADTLRLRGTVPYAMLLRFDADGRLLYTDGGYTTNKAIGRRAAKPVDIAAIAATMKPTGVLSPRQTAYAAFAQGPITINYGSPAVRERTVWGGTLVPFDTVWRTGANEAAHLATSKTLQLGDLTLAPGLYTLWIQHTRTATWMIVNKQVGQWGTGYTAANDLGRVAMTLAPTPAHVEDFTITIRPVAGQPRGTFEFAWGDKVATAAFTVRP
mgnify:FL=1|jgi:hypothetical protein